MLDLPPLKSEPLVSSGCWVKGLGFGDVEGLFRAQGFVLW